LTLVSLATDLPMSAAVREEESSRPVDGPVTRLADHLLTSCCLCFMLMLDRKLAAKATEVATRRREQ
jgi:hypothetical protein